MESMTPNTLALIALAFLMVGGGCVVTTGIELMNRAWLKAAAFFVVGLFLGACGLIAVRLTELAALMTLTR